MKTPILKNQNGPIYKDNFIKALKQINIKDGDTICVHSEIFNFGKPLLSKDEFLSALLDCFYEVIGKTGTLIMPTFTYSFCKNMIYDKLNSKSTMGVLTEFFRHQNGVVRTNDPIFSFAIFGDDKNAYLADTPSTFSKKCVYDVLKNKNGKIVLFGTQNLGYTFTHYVEEQANVSYRYFKEFNGILKDENAKMHKKSIMYYVRDLYKNSATSVEKQVKILKRTGNFQEAFIYNIPITSINANKYFNDTIKALKQDENALLEV
ncbi:AAC(3) family N-acetyltransferase [Campylobacter mucosalis]|uniref:AAC(3) family N-acetyltransferase n=1 Tax=Campylobacter mucosalis TaxID=202 RepID=UPI001B8B5C6D|nr:AAC(3) family N-acetyltransferase [Campylobacter mucosalis]